MVGLPTSDEDDTTLKDTKLDGEINSSEKVIAESDNMQNNSIPEEDEIPSDASDFVLKCKSVYKCKLCPRIVCLTIQTLIAHLKSKVSNQYHSFHYPIVTKFTSSDHSM